MNIKQQITAASRIAKVMLAVYNGVSEYIYVVIELWH